MSERAQAIRAEVPPDALDRRAERHKRVHYGWVEPVKTVARLLLKRREVHEVRRRPGLAAAHLVAVFVVKDEASRFPFVLDYYRRLGVEHFVVVDNRSTDGLRALLAGQPDVSVFAADGDYGDSRFGNDWLNGLLGRYCVGKWVLFVDADELLVFSERAEATLTELVAALEARGQESLQALMLDMYSDRPPHENVVAVGENPLDVCDRYDRDGYVCYTDPVTGTTWVKGGVRGRLFFDDVWRGPALNKTPLVRWRRHHAFLKSAHELWPRRLNGEGRIEAVLLHFKFTATSTEKMTDTAVRSQHTAEYDAYADVRERRFVADVTGRYGGPGDLVDDGFFTPLV